MIVPLRSKGLLGIPAVAGTPMEGGGDAGMPEKLLARLSSMNDLPEGIGCS